MMASELRWRCRRGMRELDILLEDYLNQHYECASVEEQRAFKKLLALTDPQLYGYLLGKQVPAEKPLQRVVNRIIKAEKTLQ
ncbi:MAG TPA: succinate dehydrogenase assembly factor 2 [Chromatiales bacterium]|nr:succinate dehydrogenase assembly factor 2 [Thiotrichales bacterium]HIP69005.1 succinate dehydrogenase assembly factor 2 [Chromatiales bacterium]